MESRGCSDKLGSTFVMLLESSGLEGLPVNKSTSIQEALDRCIAEITSPEEVLPLAIARAAKRLNLSLPEHEAQRLATAMLNAEGRSIQIDLDTPCALGEIEDQVKATVQRLVDELPDSIAELEGCVVEAISQAVPDVLREVAEVLGDHISKEAIEHTLQLRKIHSDRAETVRGMWGPAIDQFDLLRHIVLDWNYEALEHRRGAYAMPSTAFALTRLVARAYEVAGELISLVRDGYSDGALARWRSLHEICVVAIFLARRSDRCSEMYLSHHLVEQLRLLEVDRVTGAIAVRDAQRERYARNLRIRKTAAVKKFGAAFARDYGWASVELGRDRTTFRDLESQVGLETLRRGYQQANSTVHGGALAALTRISLGPDQGIDGAEISPAYGCEVAMNYATASLSMLVAELSLYTENADLVAMSLVIHNAGRKIREQISQVQKKEAGESPRAKLLMRKTVQRHLQGKTRPIFRRS